MELPDTQHPPGKPPTSTYSVSEDTETWDRQVILNVIRESKQTYTIILDSNCFFEAKAFLFYWATIYNEQKWTGG